MTSRLLTKRRRRNAHRISHRSSIVSSHSASWLLLVIGMALTRPAVSSAQPTCQLTNWKSNNLTQFTSAPKIWSEMTVQQSGGGPSLRYDLIGRDGNNLTHYWWTKGTNWRGENLRSLANQRAGGQAITGDPAYRVNYQNGAARHDVFAADPFHLIHYWWTRSDGWRSEDLTAITGNRHRILGDPLFLPGQQNNQLRHDVFALNGSGDLIHYWWAGVRWQSDNLTHGRTRPPILSGLTGVTCSRSPSVGYEVHVFGRGSTNNLVHYWWNTTQGWNAEDLMLRADGSKDEWGPGDRSSGLIDQRRR